MSPILFAMIAICASAPLRIILQRCVATGGHQTTLLAYYFIGPGLLVLPLIDASGLLRISAEIWGLLLLNAVVWVLGGVLEMKAYERLNASSGEIFGTVAFIITVISGVLLFGEPLSTLQLWGFAVIMLGIGVESWRREIGSRRAALFRMLAAVFTGSGVVMNKWLVEQGVPSSVVVFTGFMVPGAIYLGLARKEVTSLGGMFRAAPLAMASIPILAAVAYIAAVAAFQHGALSISEAIFQSVLALIVIIEALILGIRTDLRRRVTAAGLCTAGALLVIVG